MKRGIVYNRQLDINLVDIQNIFTSLIEPQISEDVYKFNLKSNNKLLRQFIVYRIVSFIFSTLENSNTKTIFVLPKQISPALYIDNGIFVYNTIRKLASILSLNIFTEEPFKCCIKIIDSRAGEGQELRNRLSGIILSNKKNINLQNLNKFLKKYNIHKIQGEISQNFNIKLGLFVT